MYIHVVEAEKLLYFVANWSSRNIENVFFLSLFETRQRAKESYRELKRTSKLLYKEWFLYKVRIPISGQLTILQNRFSLKYQQIKNTWTERTKYFPTQKTPTMHLTGWHLLLVSKLSDWLDFWCNNFHPSSRGDEVKGREEHPVWGDGESRRVTADSKPEKHQQFVVLVSVTVRVIIRQCPCTMCERHLAFFLLTRNWYWHSGKVLDSTAAECHLRSVNVAAERTINGEVSLPRGPRLSLLLSAR